MKNNSELTVEGFFFLKQTIFKYIYSNTQYYCMEKNKCIKCKTEKYTHVSVSQYSVAIPLL